MGVNPISVEASPVCRRRGSCCFRAGSERRRDVAATVAADERQAARHGTIADERPSIRDSAFRLRAAVTAASSFAVPARRSTTGINGVPASDGRSTWWRRWRTAVRMSGGGGTARRRRLGPRWGCGRPGRPPDTLTSTRSGTPSFRPVNTHRRPGLYGRSGLVMSRLNCDASICGRYAVRVVAAPVAAGVERLVGAGLSPEPQPASVSTAAMGSASFARLTFFSREPPKLRRGL